MKKNLLALFLILFSQISVADFSTALDAYQRGDMANAASQFKTLSNHNDADAQYMLGYMYALGEGVSRDYVESHKWLNIAASQSKDGASKARDKIARRMSRSQIARARQLAKNWKPIPTRLPPSIYSPQSRTMRFVNSRGTIIKVQSKLSELGYGPGPADGAPGRRTRDAIREYQIDNRLMVNGQITRELVGHLLPTTRVDSPIWGYPHIWSIPTSKPNRSTLELIEDLEALIKKIKANQAADRWVVKELRQLLRKNQRTWPHMQMRERFTRNDFRLGRNWEVTSGRFHVQPGVGLQSDAIATFSSRGDSRKQLAAAILNSFIGGDNRHLRKRQVAQITSNRKISNAFATRARFGSIDRNSRITLMLSRGGKRDSGYRLVLNTSGKRDEVSLVSVNRSGRTIIEKFRGRLGLANGSSHYLEWTRDKSGRMAVALDGRELFKVANTNIRKGFKQISITNIGGNYVLRNLMLLDAG